MKLYDAAFPGTRGCRVRWLLEELEVPYDRIALAPGPAGFKSPEHLARHPHGSVPALEIGGQVLLESTAICMHLADLHPERGLAPAIGSDQRARWYQWISYCGSTLDEVMVTWALHGSMLPEAKRKPERVEQSRAVWAISGPFLESTIGGGPWLLGETFSAVDVVLGYDLWLGNRLEAFTDLPGVAAYYQRLSARPAFTRGFAGS